MKCRTFRKNYATVDFVSASLVIAMVKLATSECEHLNNSTIYRRTYDYTRVHTPGLCPLLTALCGDLWGMREERRGERDKAISFGPFGICCESKCRTFLNRPIHAGCFIAIIYVRQMA